MMKSGTIYSKGKTRKLVPTYACNNGKGGVQYVTNRGYADAMNAKFGAPVLEAKEAAK